jgi:CCR4-NOT transcription complex subunit 9
MRKESASKACAALVALEDKPSALQSLLKFLKSSPESVKAVWGHFGVVAVILGEIVEAYGGRNSEGIVPALEVLEMLCSDKEVRNKCIQAQIPLYLYPILTAPRDELENTKQTALSAILSMIGDEDPGTVEFFKNTELVPLCLRNMDMGQEPTKFTAIKVFYAIISDSSGLKYACQTYDRFMATSMVLKSMLKQMEAIRSPRLLEMVLKVFLRLCIMENAKCAFKKNKPVFSPVLKEIIEENKGVKKIFDEFVNAIS